jgi:hypothetical protein
MMAQRRSRSIALLFLQPQPWIGVSGQCHPIVQEAESTTLGKSSHRGNETKTRKTNSYKPVRPNDVE